MKRTTLITASLLTAAMGLALAPSFAGAADPPAPPAEQAQLQTVNETAFLGVDAVPIHPEARRDLDLKPGTALTIRNIGPGTPADQAGLKPGDVLVKLNDQLLINPQQLAVLVRTFTPGDAITLHVLRDGEPVTLNATLAGRVLESHPMIERMPRPPMPNVGDLDALFEQLRGPGIDPFGPGADVHDMFDQMQRRMFEQRDEMHRMLDQMRNRIGAQGIHSSISVNDGEHILQLQSDGQDKHLTVKTQEGEVLFDGPLPEDGKAEGLPEDIQKKVDDLSNNNRIELHMPQPKPKQHESLPVA